MNIPQYSDHIDVAPARRMSFSSGALLLSVLFAGCQPAQVTKDETRHQIVKLTQDPKTLENPLGHVLTIDLITEYIKQDIPEYTRMSPDTQELARGLYAHALYDQTKTIDDIIQVTNRYTLLKNDFEDFYHSERGLVARRMEEKMMSIGKMLGGQQKIIALQSELANDAEKYLNEIEKIADLQRDALKALIRKLEGADHGSDDMPSPVAPKELDQSSVTDDQKRVRWNDHNLEMNEKADLIQAEVDSAHEQFIRDQDLGNMLVAIECINLFLEKQGVVYSADADVFTTFLNQKADCDSGVVAIVALLRSIGMNVSLYCTVMKNEKTGKTLSHAQMVYMNGNGGVTEFQIGTTPGKPLRADIQRHRDMDRLNDVLLRKFRMTSMVRVNIVFSGMELIAADTATFKARKPAHAVYDESAPGIVSIRALMIDDGVKVLPRVGQRTVENKKRN